MNKASSDIRLARYSRWRKNDVPIETWPDNSCHLFLLYRIPRARTVRHQPGFLWYNGIESTAVGAQFHYRRVEMTELAYENESDQTTGRDGNRSARHAVDA